MTACPHFGVPVPEKPVSRRAILGATAAASTAVVIAPGLAHAGEVKPKQAEIECLADLMQKEA